MSIVILNTVSLNQAPLNHIGERGKGGGSGGGTPSYENGVYIQHIDGNLYTSDQWSTKGYANDKANGVAVISDEAQFTISKTDLNPSKGQWSSNTTSTAGAYTTTNQSLAETDYDGKTNTAKITGGVALLCANYEFPNGEKGHLPSLGEWVIAYRNKGAIVEALNLIGGDSISESNYLWSSTQYDYHNSWLFFWKKGSVGNDEKKYQYLARAFGVLL